jgi:hypothetical protein
MKEEIIKSFVLGKDKTTIKTIKEYCEENFIFYFNRENNTQKVFNIYSGSSGIHKCLLGCWEV